MKGRVRLFIIAVLGATMICGVATSGAFAAGTTAFTCVEGSPGQFLTSDCNSTGATGNLWKHETIPLDLSTELLVAPKGNIVGKTHIGLATVTITATEASCPGCTLRNHEEVGGHMDVTGPKERLRLKGVTISSTSCKVVGGQIETEPLRFTSTLEGTVIKAELSPEEPGTFAIVNLENNGAETCVLGTKITITGKMTMTLNGAIASFKTGASELLVGTQKFELSGELTLSGGIAGGEHSISLTKTET